jgi:hypothetical protein
MAARSRTGLAVGMMAGPARRTDRQSGAARAVARTYAGSLPGFTDRPASTPMAAPRPAAPLAGAVGLVEPLVGDVAMEGGRVVLAVVYFPTR